MKVGDLVQYVGFEDTIGIVVGFDTDNDPVVGFTESDGTKTAAFLKDDIKVLSIASKKILNT